MNYDYREKKIVAVLNNKIETGIALNVLGHLAISIGNYAKDHMGRPILHDASGVTHLGIARYPLIITKANENKIRLAIKAARDNTNILFADYPRQMLETGHDDELADSLLLVKEEDIQYLGAIFFGNSEDINLITGKFSLYK